MARAHEIQVDVARDGELLFADGRHRLSIAKLLDLDAVPVTFLVRHEGWMERRDRAFERGSTPDHPDCRELPGASVTDRPSGDTDLGTA